MLTRSVEHQPPTSHITKPFLKSWGPSSSSSVPKYPQPFGILFYPFLCRTHRFYPCRRHRTLWSTCRRPSRRPFRLPPPRPPRRCSFRQLRCRTSGLLWSLRWVEWPWCGIGRSFRQHPWCSRWRLSHLRWSSWIRIYLWRTSWWRYVWLSSVPTFATSQNSLDCRLLRWSRGRLSDLPRVSERPSGPGQPLPRHLHLP